MYNLSLIHYYGKGVPVNFEKRMNYFTVGGLGLHNAEYFVAGMLFHGEGVKQSYSRSVKYYKKIIKDNLANESYITESYFQLGYCYLLGIGLKENSQIA